MSELNVRLLIIDKWRFLGLNFFKFLFFEEKSLQLNFEHLIFPQGRAAQAESISFKSASLVPTQVFAVFATDGEASSFQELQSEILRRLTVWAHQPGTVHIPEPPVNTCTEKDNKRRKRRISEEVWQIVMSRWEKWEHLKLKTHEREKWQNKRCFRYLKCWLYTKYSFQPQRIE